MVAGPLTGLRVVDGSSFVAGPSGALALGLLGAEVIRFDPIGGAVDYRRAPLTKGGRSLYWAGLNKGKRSIAVNLRDPRGRELIQALITAPGDGAGLYLTNAVGRTWLDYEELRSRRADLIMVHVLGQPDGRAAVDYTVNAGVGVPQITGPAGGGPVNNALPAWDLLTGLYVALGLLSADRRRRATGQGELIKISLADVALATVDQLGYLSEVQINNDDRPADGNFVYGTFGVDFVTADGNRVMIVALTPQQWRDLIQVTETKRLVEAIEQELGADFERDEDRYRHRQLLQAIISPWFSSRTSAEVVAALDETRVLTGPYRTFRDVVNDPATRSNPLFTDVEHGGIGQVLAASTPLLFHQQGRPATPPAPLLGQDTEWVLSEVLHLPAMEIGQLHDEGVVSSS